MALDLRRILGENECVFVTFDGAPEKAARASTDHKAERDKTAPHRFILPGSRSKTSDQPRTKAS